jgi:hypothetical protein
MPNQVVGRYLETASNVVIGLIVVTYFYRLVGGGRRIARARRRLRARASSRR